MTTTTQSAATFAGQAVDQQFIAGQWRPGRSERVNTDKNPYDDAVVAQIQQASPEDLDEAYRAAEKAQKDWASTAPNKRAAVIRRAADLGLSRRGPFEGL
ncbi:MAG: aldehyde dehydrogenase family protein [Nesterenkonia sp.]